MMDWAEGIQGRNYGIRRAPDARSLADVAYFVASLTIIAAVLLFYSWVRNQAISQGYQEQVLQEQETALLHSERLLVIEEQTLKSLDRIDLIARSDLRMVPVQPGQVIAATFHDEPRTGTALAMARTPHSSSESKRFSATD